MPAQVDVVVIGAGLAGLAAAGVAHRAGLTVLVLEASDGVGGRVRTDVIDGFRCDRGFQVVLTAYPELARLNVAELDLRRFDPGAMVWLADGGYLVGDPLRQPRTLIATARSPVGTLRDKVRLLGQRRRWVSTPVPDLLRQPDVPTLAALRARGFSPHMINRFFTPLAGGFQQDPELVSSVRMFDTVMAMLTRGYAAVPAAGMGAIPQQMAEALPAGSIRLNCPVSALDGRSVRLADEANGDGGVDGGVLRAGALIIATDGPSAAGLAGLKPVDSTSVGCVYFAARQPPVSHKLIMLNATGAGPALNVAVLSNAAPSYAPPGWHLVVAATPSRIDADLGASVRAQLRGWWGAVVDGWRELTTYRIEHGQPRSGTGLAPRQAVSLGDGRFVCGDHRDTPSIQGALFSGRRAGEAAVAHLAARRGPSSSSTTTTTTTTPAAAPRPPAPSTLPEISGSPGGLALGPWG